MLVFGRKMNKNRWLSQVLKFSSSQKVYSPLTNRHKRCSGNFQRQPRLPVRFCRTMPDTDIQYRFSEKDVLSASGTDKNQSRL